MAIVGDPEGVLSILNAIELDLTETIVEAFTPKDFIIVIPHTLSAVVRRHSVRVIAVFVTE